MSRLGIAFLSLGFAFSSISQELSGSRLDLPFCLVFELEDFSVCSTFLSVLSPDLSLDDRESCLPLDRDLGDEWELLELLGDRDDGVED